MIKGLQKIVIDFGGDSVKIRDPKPKPRHPADRGIGVDNVAGGARPHYGWGNVAKAAFSRLPCGAAHHDLTRGSVRVPRCPVLPIKARAFPEHRERSF